MNLSGKNILLGVSGGIAAYKSVLLLRELQKAGADVRVVMTRSATRFVGVETFTALSRHEVGVEVFNDASPGEAWTRHIHWSEWADLFLIAPCTANTLAKVVHGFSDNLLTSIALAARCPILLCPTMDAEMIENPAVQDNLALAGAYGLHLLMPESGYLASGLEGTGRLPETEAILQRIAELFSKGPARTSNNAPLQLKTTSGSDAPASAGSAAVYPLHTQPLAGKTVLVTAGPTREPIDAVRFISNPSSGKMGVAMAEAAKALGADVQLLHGPISVPLPADIPCHRFTTAEELFQLVQSRKESDVVIMAAAVSDYRAATVQPGKQKKEKGLYKLELTRNTDILEWLGSQKSENQILIGFAMETEKLETYARGKLEKKNLDWICANNLQEEGAGFESDTNRIRLMNRTGKVQEFTGPKRQIAEEILRSIFEE